MRVLVTGADGFVGRHLCRYLGARGDEVIAVGGPRALHGGGPRELHGGGPRALHDGGPRALQGEPRALPEGDALFLGAALDITDAEATLRVVADASPEAVIHLAGFASVGRSHAQAVRAFEVNATGTVSLLEAVRQGAPEARVLAVSSGEVYGPIPLGARASESSPLAPLSPYASGKAAAELAARQYQASYGTKAIVARPFNHLGAGQAQSFVVPTFAAQLGAISRGEASPSLSVGDLSPIRDFSHVEDVVRAYRLLLERGVPGEAYNVCSGEGWSIRALLDALVELAGLEVSIEVDPARLRPSEMPSLVGSPVKLEALGWRRETTVQAALRDALAKA